MIRRFNFTGRVKIRQKSVKLEVSDINTTSVAFSCEADLLDYEFPSHASIFVEVYSKSFIRRRFSMGTIGEPISLVSVSIPEFSNFPAFNFRIYVIDMEGHYNKILGRSSTLFSATDEDGDGETSILPIRYVDDLNQIWKLEFDADLPYLKINNKIEGIVDLVNSNEPFKHTFLPAVLREILTRLFIIDDDPFDESDVETPKGKWAIFIRETIGKPDLLQKMVNDEEVTEDVYGKMDSIEEIVDIFTKRHFRNISEYAWE